MSDLGSGSSRKALNSFSDKREKIQNNVTLAPHEKEKTKKDTIDTWITKKMKPKKALKRGEFYIDFITFRETLFEGIEFKHEQEKLEG